MRKVKYVCSKCGSENVGSEAIAEWDSEKQEWIVQALINQRSYCNECVEPYIRIEERDL